MPRMPELKKIQIQNFTPAAGVDVNSIKYSGQFIIREIIFSTIFYALGVKKIKFGHQKASFFILFEFQLFFLKIIC